MMNKSYKTCAILINGVVYNGYGICSLKDYFIAKEEDISINEVVNQSLQFAISDYEKQKK